MTDKKRKEEPPIDSRVQLKKNYKKENVRVICNLN